MHELIEAAKTINWPGALVLTALIVCVAWVLVRVFGGK